MYRRVSNDSQPGSTENVSFTLFFVVCGSLKCAQERQVARTWRNKRQNHTRFPYRVGTGGRGRLEGGTRVLVVCSMQHVCMYARICISYLCTIHAWSMCPVDVPTSCNESGGGGGASTSESSRMTCDAELRQEERPPRVGVPGEKALPCGRWRIVPLLLLNILSEG